MWEKLQEVFDLIGLPYSRQGSFSEDEKLPDSFFTFWNKSSEYEGYFSNRPTKCIWVWNVFFYTNNPELIYSQLNDFITTAKENGFIVGSQGKDLPTDEPNYFGRYVEISYIENLNVN